MERVTLDKTTHDTGSIFQVDLIFCSRDPDKHAPLWCISVAWSQKTIAGSYITSSEDWFFWVYDDAAQFLEALGETESIKGPWYQTLSTEASF